MQKGVVVWFTGLPNSGKTTISKLVAENLEASHEVEVLDSDEVPRSLTKDLSSDWKTRQKQKCSNLIFVAKLLYKHRIIVLISSVGRLKEMRAQARDEIQDFVEVYLKSPLEVRLERDQKAKYQRYPTTIHYYEETDKPEVLLETDVYTAQESVVEVLNYLRTNGYI